ncbi:MAG: cyclic nucleotide-binding domain-containing protein [Spirochaetes bacterium]|nr:cyclic nucleotide-binding domain-containing protein [Spirochaetota bacterium]
MEIIKNNSLLYSYIDRYKINDLFQTDMAQFMELIYYQPGEFLLHNGQQVNHIYFLVSGKIKIYSLLENGKSFLNRFNRPLSILGEVEFLNNTLSSCEVEILFPSYCIRMPYDDVKKYAYNDPEFLRFMIQSISHKLYSTNNVTNINQLYPLENRLASYLISLSLDEDSLLYIDEIKTSSLKEIAELLATSYRHLNRIIKKLMDKGIIEREKGKIKIIDFEKLKELAGNNVYE